MKTTDTHAPMTQEDIERIQTRDLNDAMEYDKFRLNALFNQLKAATDCDERDDVIQALAVHTNEMFMALHHTYSTTEELLKDLNV